MKKPGQEPHAFEGLTKGVWKRHWAWVALFVGVSSAYGQTSFEITPFVGGVYGGNIKLRSDGHFDSLAKLDDAISFGAAGGVRFGGDECDSCNVVEFRWMRQNRNLGFTENVPNGTQFRQTVTLDHFLGDFTHEFPIRETHDRVSPFVTLSLGAARMSTPVESRMRFEFGIGGGVKIFPKPRWGFRFQVEYLPMVMHAEVQTVVCTGGCVVTINTGVMNQLALSFGPTFRF